MNQQQSKGVDIVKELGLETLPEDQKAEIVAALSQALQAKITTRVMATLTEEEKAQVDKLVTAGDDQKVGEYIASVVPGLDAIGYDELQRMRGELLSLNANIQEAVKTITKK